MRNLILQHLEFHWDECLEVIYEITLADVEELSDRDLFQLFRDINEID